MVSVSPPTADFLSCIKIVQPHLVCPDSGLWTQTEDFLLLKHNKSPRLEAVFLVSMATCLYWISKDVKIWHLSAVKILFLQTADWCETVTVKLLLPEIRALCSPQYHICVTSASHTRYMFALSSKFISCVAVTLTPSLSVFKCWNVQYWWLVQVWTCFIFHCKKTSMTRRGRAAGAQMHQRDSSGEADVFGHVQRRESGGCWTKDDEDGVSVQEEKSFY